MIESSQHAAGWYPDPSEEFDFRWFDGTRWSSRVSRDGLVSSSSIDDASSAGLPEDG